MPSTYRDAKQGPDRIREGDAGRTRRKFPAWDTASTRRDPRAPTYADVAVMGKEKGNTKYYECHEIDDYIKREKKLNAKVDFSSRRLTPCLGWTSIFQPSLAVSRIAGWAAHHHRSKFDDTVDPSRTGLRPKCQISTQPWEKRKTYHRDPPAREIWGPLFMAAIEWQRLKSSYARVYMETKCTSLCCQRCWSRMEPVLSRSSGTPRPFTIMGRARGSGRTGARKCAAMLSCRASDGRLYQRRD